jgi:hypothetical protein
VSEDKPGRGTVVAAAAVFAFLAVCIVVAALAGRARRAVGKS